MSDKYFNEAQRKVLIVDEGDAVSKSIIEVARIIYDEAQALKPADPRLSDDPLTALTAVMRHHRLGVLCQSDQGDWAADEDMVVVRDDGGGMLDKLIVVNYAALWAESITANDIKPEQ